jgi:hypothetical protein
MRPSPALLAGLALSAPACVFMLDFDDLQGGFPADGGSGTGGAGGDASASCLGTDPTSVAECLAEVFCRRVRECAGPMVEALYTSDTVCTSLLARVAEDNVFVHVAASQADGYLDYDPSRLSECAARIQNTACSDLALLPPGCPSLVGGRQTSGAPCRSTLDCADGLYCNVSSACPGQCTARLSGGAPCTEDGNCTTDLRCMRLADADPELCRRPGPLDAPCGGNIYPSCQLGLYCLGSSGDQPGICKSAAALFASDLGQACNVTAGPLCKPGYFCLIGNGRCVPESTDQTCALAVPDQCPPDYVCSLQGRCELLPTEGQVCNFLNPLVPACRGEAVCLGGVCRNLIPIGGDCAAPERCASGNCSAGKCSARPCQ